MLLNLENYNSVFKRHTAKCFFWQLLSIRRFCIKENKSPNKFRLEIKTVILAKSLVIKLFAHFSASILYSYILFLKKNCTKSVNLWFPEEISWNQLQKIVICNRKWFFLRIKYLNSDFNVKLSRIWTTSIPFAAIIMKVGTVLVKIHFITAMIVSIT